MDERQEAAINGRRSRNSERVRAHLNERMFRAKPDTRIDRTGAAEDTRRRSQRMTPDCMQFDRTNETRKWGVSDPLGAGLGAKKGAAKWGSLTPHSPPTAVATAAVAAPRAAQSAAR